MKRRMILSLMLVSLLVVMTAGLTLADSNYNEAPMLKKMVEAGELPPVEERLPVEPKIVKPMDEIGKYGGTLKGVVMEGEGIYYVNHPALLQFSWNLEGDVVKVAGIEPNIAKKVDISDDARVVTVHLREGHKWSDGEPYTAEDIDFIWNDLWLDENYPEDVNGYLKLEGKAPEFEVLDKYTVRFTWHKSFPTIKKMLAWNPGIFDIAAHAAKPYHPKYNDEIENYDKIIAYLAPGGALGRDLTTPELPTIAPWDVVEYQPGNKVVLERNPYYHQVDTAGNQLPYIDNRVLYELANRELSVLRAMQGDIEAQIDMLNFKDITLYKENEEKGNYTAHAIPSARGLALYLNRYSPNAELRELFRNRQFRIALSLATDRQEISKFLFKGLAEPVAYTYNPYTAIFPDDVEELYIEHNPEKANKILDELGLVDTDGDGIREFKNGEPLTIVGFVAVEKNDQVDLMELVRKHWKEVGIDYIVNSIKRSSLFAKLESGNHHDIVIWPIDGATEPLMKGGRWAPVDLGGGKWWAREAYEWYISEGERGTKPDGNIMKTLELYTSAMTETDLDKQFKTLRELGKLHAEEVMNIGLVLPPKPFIAGNDVGNIRPFMVGNTYKFMRLIKPQQFYKK